MVTRARKVALTAGRCGYRPLRVLSLALLVCLLPALACAETLTLSFLGDCSIGEAVQYKGHTDGYTDTVDKNGYDWPFSLVMDTLKSDDCTFANLEVVFTERTRHQDKRYPLCAEPKYVQVLTESGVDVVNTANNHCFDFQTEGYDDSCATLDTAGIKRFGSPGLGSALSRDELLTVDIKGVRIGAVGLSYPSERDLPRIEKRIASLREAGCELVIVSLHWGREVHDTPDSWQYKYARSVIDMGADVIWGHHPHILQQVHFYQGKPIFYGTMSNVDRDTGIFQLEYALFEGAPALSVFRVLPCQTSGKGDYRARPIEDEAARKTMLKKLIFKKNISGMERLPATFADTGEVFLENGAFVP